MGASIFWLSIGVKTTKWDVEQEKVYNMKWSEKFRVIKEGALINLIFLIQISTFGLIGQAMDILALSANIS